MCSAPAIRLEDGGARKTAGGRSGNRRGMKPTGGASRPQIVSLADSPVEAAEMAAAALASEEVVLLPTDTVYGLAALPGSTRATTRLFEIKRRPATVSVAVLVSEPSHAWDLADDVPPPLADLMARHWPGALTVVLERRGDMDWALGGGGTTVGVRCPDRNWLRGLLRSTGPLAVTSANLHRQPTPATATEALSNLGAGVSVAVDGGNCSGEASTVVAWEGRLRVLRAGPLLI